MIGWKRRSSAASFSRCLRYSSSVVAPIVCSSPRASIGFRIEAASIAPSAAPAPTRVCSSSMNRIVSPRVRISFSTFFSRSSKSPAVAAAGDERAEVEGVELLALQRLGDVVRDDLLGEALDDRRLADAGLADQHRVVLRAAREHLHQALDLAVAADHRVELVLAGELGEVPAELVEHRRAGRALAGWRPRRRSSAPSRPW